MLDLLGRRLELVLEPCTLTVPAGARVEVDGSDTARTVLVECWAHLGPPKSAQKHKVLTDAFNDLGLHHALPTPSHDSLPRRPQLPQPCTTLA